MIRKTILFFAWSLLFQEAYTQEAYPERSPPLREANFIKSKLFFIEADVNRGSALLENFKNIFGAVEQIYEKHRAVSEQISSKESELIAKKNKSGQEKTFLKMVPCLKELMSIKYKSSGWDADNLGDCYLANKVNPNVFRRSVDGILLYNKTQIHKVGDELSKLVDLIEDNTPVKETPGMFENYLHALAEKKKLESGWLDKLKQKEDFFQREYVYRKKIEFKVEMKLNTPCSAESIPDLGSFAESKSNIGFASETSKDILKSLNKDIEVSAEIDSGKNTKDLCSIFNDIAKSDEKMMSPVEKCEEEASGVEKINQLNQNNIEKETNEKKLKGICCLASSIPSSLGGKDLPTRMNNLKKIVYMNLIQGLALGAALNNSYSTLVGIQEKSGACGYLIRDHSKKELTWISEKDFLANLKDIYTLARDSRPEDSME